MLSQSCEQWFCASYVTELDIYDDMPSEVLHLLLLGAWYRCLDILHLSLRVFLLMFRVKLLLLLLLLYRLLLLMELEIGRRQSLSQVIHLQ